MLSSSHYDTAHSIHNSGRRLVIAVTGGGSGAIAALVQTPGASRSVLETVIPYSEAALREWIGGMPNQACSAETARAMAMAAFVRARKLAPNVDPAQLVGIGFTGSLATDRVKRGQRRIHLSAQTATRTEVHSIVLKELPAEALQGAPLSVRADDEAFSTAALLWLTSRACDVRAAEFAQGTSERWEERVEDAPEAWSKLLKAESRMMLMPVGANDDPANPAAAPMKVVFPGAFNPPHAGHLRMATLAEQRLGSPALWELSIMNVDKPPLDFLAIRERVTALQAADSTRAIALTHAATFAEKAELFPGSTFVVGADTIARIAEPRYYSGDAARRDAAIDAIAGAACRFLVFGRVTNGRFATLGELALPSALAAICDEVPASEFREDVSSTELRGRT